VYAGGDVALDGPSSIVKAAADGKAVAQAIARALGGAVPPEPAVAPAPIDLAAMVQRRARREYRVPLEQTPTTARGGFEPTVLGYTAEQAREEAARCLDCHTMCSLCVGVCPNMALMTYQSEPFAAALPRLHVEDGQVMAGEPEAYRAEQRLQIAVLTDFCNECGNCVTPCPTAGRPYRDKPRLYLDRAEFEAEDDNAFMLFDDGSVEGRFAGQTHRLSVDGTVEYEGPVLSAKLERSTLAVVEAERGPGAVDGSEVSLRPAADMYVLVRGISGSMPQLPRASEVSSGGGRLSHPGYADRSD
jgi:putative selenate reductase